MMHQVKKEKKATGKLRQKLVCSPRFDVYMNSRAEPSRGEKNLRLPQIQLIQV